MAFFVFALLSALSFSDEPKRPTFILTMMGDPSAFFGPIDEHWDLNSRLIDEDFPKYFKAHPFSQSGLIDRFSYLGIPVTTWFNLYPTEAPNLLSTADLLERINAHPELLNGRPFSYVKFRLAFQDYLLSENRDSRHNVLQTHSQNWSFDEKINFLQNYMFARDGEYTDPERLGKIITEGFVDEGQLAQAILNGIPLGICRDTVATLGLMAKDLGLEAVIDTFASAGANHVTLLIGNPNEEDRSIVKINGYTAQKISFDSDPTSATYLGDVSTNHRYYTVSQTGEFAPTPIASVLSSLGEVLILNSGGDPNDARLFPNGLPSALMIGAKIPLSGGWKNFSVSVSFAALPDHTKLLMLGLSHQTPKKESSFYAHETGVTLGNQMMMDQLGNQRAKPEIAQHVFLYYNGEIRKVLFEDEDLKLSTGLLLNFYEDTAFVKMKPSLSMDISAKPFVSVHWDAPGDVEVNSKLEARQYLDIADLRDTSTLLPPKVVHQGWNWTTEFKKEIGNEDLYGVSEISYGNDGFGGRFGVEAGIEKSDDFDLKMGIRGAKNKWSMLMDGNDRYFLKADKKIDQWKLGVDLNYSPKTKKPEVRINTSVVLQ